MIVCSAIRYKNDIICSARHFDDIMLSVIRKYKDDNWFTAEQGFIDQNCVFYNRKEAYKEALICGQVEKNDQEIIISEQLY